MSLDELTNKDIELIVNLTPKKLYRIMRRTGYDVAQTRFAVETYTSRTYAPIQQMYQRRQKIQ